jgi:hypothetical protein
LSHIVAVTASPHDTPTGGAAMARDIHGRFAPKEPEALSPAYARRLARGTARGQSLSRTRGHATKAVPMWQSRRVFEVAPYRTSLEVLRQMRHGRSLYQASREAHVAPDTVRRYVGAALTRGPDGRYRAKPNDRLYRRMLFLDEHGRLDVEVANAREASKLAAYWAAVDHYLHTGETRALRRFDRLRLRLRDKSVRRFVTDPDVLDRLAHAGELSFEDLYELAS